MESQLYLMLLGLTYVLLVLSFLKPQNIVLRAFSAMTLVAVALVGLYPMLYVGFGSQNAIPYSGSMAGDVGRSGEIPVLRMYGAMALVQFVYALYLMVEWAGNYIRDQSPDAKENSAQQIIG